MCVRNMITLISTANISARTVMFRFQRCGLILIYKYLLLNFQLYQTNVTDLRAVAAFEDINI